MRTSNKIAQMVAPSLENIALAKHQAPSSKLQGSTNLQAPKHLRPCALDLGPWSLTGSWSLDLGASAPRRL
jgi:hypothetical protein